MGSRKVFCGLYLMFTLTLALTLGGCPSATREAGSLESATSMNSASLVLSGTYEGILDCYSDSTRPGPSRVEFRDGATLLITDELDVYLYGVHRYVGARSTIEVEGGTCEVEVTEVRILTDAIFISERYTYLLDFGSGLEERTADAWTVLTWTDAGTVRYEGETSGFDTPYIVTSGCAGVLTRTE